MSKKSKGTEIEFKAKLEIAPIDWRKVLHFMRKVQKNPIWRIVGTGILLYIIAAGINWFLQYGFFAHDANATWEWINEHEKVYWYSTAIVFLLLAGLNIVVRRPLISGAIMWALAEIINFVNINKMAVRGVPLLPEDLALADQAGTMTKFVDFWSIVGLVVAIGLTIFLGIFTNHLLQKYRRSIGVPRWVLSQGWKGWVIRALGMLMVAWYFMCDTEFVRHNQGTRHEAIPWLEEEFIAWNQKNNFDHVGVVLGFLYNLQKTEMAQPEGYSEEAIDAIYKKYDAVREVDNAGRASLADEKYNIVVVLNESFYDPDIIGDYYRYTGGELLPNLHKIQAKYPHGTMYSVDYGGGTANIEFEVDTGLTNYWAGTVPYTSLLPHVESVPSVASWAKQNGYSTTAIHAYNGGMYKRNVVLPKEGFDKFIDESEMKHTEKDGNSGYINDRAIYAETLDVLRESNDPQMLSVITMQNHTPYTQTNYDKRDFELTQPAVGDGMDENGKAWVETYLQSLHSSDAYLGEFISELDALDEKTVVLFYGDHSAGVFPVVEQNAEKSVRDLSRQTPYFVYANFELSDADLELPMTTPNCLVNTMYDVLNVQKPTLSYVTAAACEAEPVLTDFYFNGDEPKAVDALKDYQLVTYDILGGKQYFIPKD